MITLMNPLLQALLAARFIVLLFVLAPRAAESVDRAPLARHEGRVDAHGGVEISQVQTCHVP